MQARTKVFVTASVLLLISMLTLAAVPTVRAAVLRWFGYVPGAGLVGEGQVRVLAEPVPVTRDGVTLTIEQVMASSDRTFVQFSVEGWPWAALAAAHPGEGCLDHPTLRFDDRELSAVQPENAFGWDNGYQLKGIFPAIPSDVDDVTLVMPCLILSRPGEAPEDWQVPLKLIPAPPGTVFPVIEISTPVQETPTAAPQTEAGLTTEGISLALDRAVQMDDGYLIYATLHWENTGYNTLDIVDQTYVHLRDAGGNELPFTFDYEALADHPWTPGQTAFAIKTGPIQVDGPLTLTLDSLAADAPAEARFVFDPGPNPQPGQTWPVDQTLDVGYGHSVHVIEAVYPTPPAPDLPVMPGLDFTLESNDGVVNASLLDEDHPPIAGGGGGSGSFPGPFTSGFSFPAEFPPGPLNIKIASIGIVLPGPWEARWTPPASESQSSAATQPAACLTRESWPQALKNAPAIPAGLAGKLALFDVPAPDYIYEVSVANLNDSGRTLVSRGDSPSFSPDGARIVYNGPMVDSPPDGLYITELASGETALLPGSARGDSGPVWSPDGNWIAFSRGPSSGLIGAPGPYAVMIVHPDGSGLQELAQGRVMSWIPDGTRLLYSVVERDGIALNTVDIQTRVSSSLFDLNYQGSVAVSPDGTRLAFEEMLPLEKYGLFVSDLDGSHRVLLADGDPYIATVPVWSPDGKWVLASVQDPDFTKQPNPVLALIGVEDCRIVPLPSMGGYASGWLP